MNTLIFGYGAIGQAIAARLKEAGRVVTVAQRSRPRHLPAGIQFIACDLCDADSVAATAQGADEIILAAGLPYHGPVWLTSWPVIMRNFLYASERTQARTLFIDNLYMYGPQNAPLTETMPLNETGDKVRARTLITRLWQQAVATGRVRFMALRAADFYGPAVTLSHAPAAAFQRVALGKAVWTMLDPDMPHAFTFTHDVARAAQLALEGPEARFGRAFHVPSTEGYSLRHLLALASPSGAPRIAKVPFALIDLLAHVWPFARSLQEMRFQMDRPYSVNAEAFIAAYGMNATPPEEAVAQIWPCGIG